MGDPLPFELTWRHGLFAHWPCQPERLRPFVPASLDLDTHDGRAWVSVLPFVVADVGLRLAPSFTRVTTQELNVRTYVRFEGTPGVFFLSVDIGAPLIAPVVRGLTGLSCYRADMAVRFPVDQIEFSSTRRRSGPPPARFEASYRPAGEAFRAEPGTVDEWLAERRRSYHPTGDSMRYTEVAHAPWPLQPAETTVHTNSLFEAIGLPTPECEPRFRYCDHLEMRASLPRRIR